jgi:hypothetical protein
MRIKRQMAFNKKDRYGFIEVEADEGNRLFIDASQTTAKKVFIAEFPES